MRLKALLACLVFSGFCGLAYELLWIRLLSLTFGSTTLSFSTVVAVFLGGLALGAWVAGRKAAGLRLPVRAYALIEIAAGALGLALYPLLRHLDVVFAGIDPGPGPLGAFTRLVVAALLLIWPTALMGATLPVVCAAMIHRDEESGRGTALVYGFNTLGAFLGAYFITYHLIPGVGVFRSILATAALNFLVGAAALFLGRGEAADASPLVPSSREDAGVVSAPAGAGPSATAEVPTAPSSVAREIAYLAPVLTFLSGFAFVCFEVVWARLFSSFLEGTVYGVGAVLICFLVGIALGSLFVAERIPARSSVGLWFAVIQVVAIGSVLLLYRELAWVAHLLSNMIVIRDSSLVPQHKQLLVVFAALFVPTACSGASFPLLTKAVLSGARHAGRALGTMYAANTVGSILGSLLTGFVLIPEFGSVGAVSLALAFLGLSAALGALLSSERKRISGLAVAAAALFLVSRYDGFDIKLIGTGAPLSQKKEVFEEYLERHKSSSQHLVYFAEGRDGTVGVYDGPDGRSMKINGLSQGVRLKLPPHHFLESLLVGMIPWVHAESPENALVIGLGAGVTVDLLRELGLTRIRVAEIEPRVLDALKAVFLGKSPVESAGVEVVIDDARHLLLVGARRSAERYDIISSMPFHPWVASSLFTREFFELARANLAPGGVFSTWFGVWKMDGEAVASLLRAFCSVFPHYVIYFVPEAGSYYLVGADHPIAFDIGRMEEVQSHQAIAEHTQLSDPYFLPSRIYATGNAETPPPPAGIVNTDDTAFVEVHAPRAGQSSPRLANFLPREFLQPSLVPERDRRRLYVDLLEHLLGAPRGQLPLVEVQSYPERARLTLAAIERLLTEAEKIYFEGRMALALNRLEEARALFDRVAAAGGELAARAKKFRAFTYSPGSEERLAAFASLDPSWDVVVWALDIDRDRALALVPREEVSANREPVGWFLSKAAAVPSGKLSAADRSTFVRVVGAKLASSTRLGLLALAEQFSREQGLASEAEAFNQKRRARASVEVARLYQEGLAAANEGRFPDAVDSLWKANLLEPGSEPVMIALLRALVEVRDEERTAKLLDGFRFLGKTEHQIEALVRAARDGTLWFGPTQPGERPSRASEAGDSQAIGRGAVGRDP